MKEANLTDREKQEIVIFTGKNGDVTLNADFAFQTIWATQTQIGDLFGIDRTTALRHINNILKDQEIDRESNVQKMHFAHSDKPVMYYSLDIILSVGYRTNSSVAIAFRRWANTVLKQYLLQGYAVNQTRLTQLNQVIDIISRSDNPEIVGVSSVLERFTRGLDILDRYDHGNLVKPQDKGKKTPDRPWKLTYEEGRRVVDSMKFGDTSNLF